MGKNIDPLLKGLHSDENKLRFLKSIYSPGDAEVADKILSINPYNSYVLEDEVEFVGKHGPKKRFVNLAKKLVDHYVERHYTNLLEDMAVDYKDEEINNYIFKKLVSGSDKEALDSGFLEAASEIAEALGKKDIAKKYLERMLKLERDSEYPFVPAGICIKLKRYNEAIDFDLKDGGYGGFYRTLNIAKKHVPQRLKEVAQKGFDRFNPDKGWFDIFTKCAEIIGKTKEAEKIIVKYSKKKQDYSSPRWYEGLVGALVKFGHIDKAKRLVDDAERREIAYKKDDGEPYDSDRDKELAELYSLVGRTSEVKDIYLAIVDEGINGGWHPSNMIRDVDRGYKLTHDKAFLVKKLEVFEISQEYNKASKLAIKLGDKKLSRKYQRMQQKIRKVKKTN